MKWFKRKPKEPKEPIPIFVQHGSLSVTHRITKDPDPRPTTVWLRITNNEGQSYITTPVRIHGRSTMIQAFPLAWITGKPEDNGQQVRVDIEMDYQ